MYFKTNIGKVGLFLGIYGNRYVIGKKKYRNFSKAIDKAINKCQPWPVSLFNTLEEVKAFVDGFCISSGKKYPL